jgi:hypothetical protein
MSDAGDHSREESAVGLRLLAITLNGTKAEGIHKEDGTRTHGENVANDAADSRGCTLEGLDSAGVIVTLDLERHGPSIADIDDAGILLTSLD